MFVLIHRYKAHICYKHKLESFWVVFLMEGVVFTKHECGNSRSAHMTDNPESTDLS